MPRQPKLLTHAHRKLPRGSDLHSLGRPGHRRPDTNEPHILMDRLIPAALIITAMFAMPHRPHRPHRPHSPIPRGLGTWNRFNRSCPVCPSLFNVTRRRSRVRLPTHTRTTRHHCWSRSDTTTRHKPFISLSKNTAHATTKRGRPASPGCNCSASTDNW